MRDSYRTVFCEAEIEIVIQKSRFIGRCFPVSNEGEAQARLDRIRKQHWDATHNCYAYIVGENGQTARFSDDGEPGGTAGMPMLDVLKKRGLRDVLVVATRYFGGVLLGAGGLVRAYTKTASEAAESSGIRLMQWANYLECSVDYPLWGRLESFLQRINAELHEVTYGVHVAVMLIIPGERVDAFVKEVVELTDGRVVPRVVSEGYAPFADTGQ